MLGKPIKYLLFLLAYTPLIVSIVVRYFFNVFAVIGALAFSAVVVLVSWHLLRNAAGDSSSIDWGGLEQPRGVEYFAFIVTYLIPFIVFIDTPTLIALAIVYSVIAYIYVSTPLFSVNPLLKMVLGYDVYVLKNGSSHSYLISRLRISESDIKLKVKQLDSDLYVEEVKSKRSPPRKVKAEGDASGTVTV